MAKGSAYAIGTRITATDNHNVLTFSSNEVGAGFSIENGLGVRSEEIHREMDTFTFAARNREVARFSCTGANNDRIKILTELFSGNIFSNVHTTFESHTFVFE